MRHPIATRLASGLAVLLLVAASPAARAELEVVATLGDLAAMSRAVVGERGDVTLLANPGEDPHFVDPKPSYVAELADADVLVLNGLALEVGWLPTLVAGSRNPAIQKGEPGYVDASRYVEPKGVPDRDVSRAEGDVHPDGNPHYTLEPRQMARVALGLGKRLGRIDAEHAEGYMERARAYAKRCLKVAERWSERFGELPEARRAVATYHESWVYLLDWLALDEVATLEPKPGVPPGPDHVADVIERMEANEVRGLLRLAYYPSSTAQQVAERTEATVLEIQGHTEEGGDYLDRIERLARRLHDVLAADEDEADDGDPER